MQVVDVELIIKHAMAYGKKVPKPAIACGVVLQGSSKLYNIMMNL
jgi:hypothetical protein